MVELGRVLCGVEASVCTEEETAKLIARVVTVWRSKQLKRLYGARRIITSVLEAVSRASGRVPDSARRA